MASSVALKKSIELDFVVSVDTPSIQKSIDRIISSIKLVPGKQNNETCLGLAELEKFNGLISSKIFATPGLEPGRKP